MDSDSLDWGRVLMFAYWNHFTPLTHLLNTHEMNGLPIDCVPIIHILLQKRFSGFHVTLQWVVMANIACPHSIRVGSDLYQFIDPHTYSQVVVLRVPSTTLCRWTGSLASWRPVGEGGSVKGCCCCSQTNKLRKNNRSESLGHRHPHHNSENDVRELFFCG